MRGSTAGIADALHAGNKVSQRKRHDTLLRVLDILVSTLIIGPAVVAYWRGTWMLMEINIFPDNLEYSSWVSLAIGSVGHIAFTLLQAPMARWFSPDKHRLTYYAASRAYTMVFGVVCVNAWRGVWCALDVYAGKEVASVVGTTMLAVVTLMGLRTVRNLSAPPMEVVGDTPDGYFVVRTMFNQAKSASTKMYVLDVLFSVAVVGNLVVVVWRGAWAFVDIFLFPYDPALSAWASLGIGYVVVTTMFSLQTVMRKLCSSVDGYFRLFLADLYFLLAFCGTINVWRGVWNLLNVYFLSESPSLSNWLTHGFSLIFLMLLNCSNSMLVRNVYIDGEEDGGDCVVFSCRYLQLFVQEKRELKQHKRQYPTETSKRKYDGDSTIILPNNKPFSETSNHVHLQLLPTTTSVETPDEPVNDVEQ